MEEELTTRQKEILEFIEEGIERRGYPPTAREISGHFGFRSPKSATDHLRALERKGYIKREPARARGVSLVRRGVPVVGAISAGSPIFASENLEGSVEIDEEFFRSSGELFALRVQGDSMIGAGIYEGDIVLIKRQNTAENGDIVAVLLDEEATLKRFYHEHKRIRLQPENPSMEPIYIRPYEARTIILGKAVGLMRKL